MKKKETNIEWLTITTWVIVCVGLITLIGYIILLWKADYINSSKEINPDLFEKFGGFIGGFVGSLWALAAILLL